MNEINPKQITQEQAQHLSGFINSLRPDWQPAGIMKALEMARGRGPVDALAVAVVRAAMNPANRTPAVIGMSGPHWAGAFVERQGPVRELVCVEHGVVESRCRGRHRRVGPPDWWEDFRRGRVAPPGAVGEGK